MSKLVFERKSKPLICLSYPSLKVYYSGTDKGTIERQREKDITSKCPQCGETWKEHIK